MSVTICVDEERTLHCRWIWEAQVLETDQVDVQVVEGSTGGCAVTSKQSAAEVIADPQCVRDVVAECEVECIGQAVLAAFGEDPGHNAHIHSLAWCNKGVGDPAGKAAKSAVKNDAGEFVVVRDDLVDVSQAGHF